MTRKRRKKPVAVGDDGAVAGFGEIEGFGEMPGLDLDLPTLDFPDLSLDFPDLALDFSEAEAALASLGAEFDAALDLLDDETKRALRALEIPDIDDADPDPD
jgi:hypothetical protein